ncbi:LppU/SCO3897 family protein [Actinoplanes regularis]|uniref:LppU/SCO3897 family protein n=1 Tax=Actinoplanes regularis TaxID=52697 RepID=UPI0024A1D41A|nr:hypothetical protein [Actinoplanes regularis]GLW29943.1 hypothetical protein Areg01_28830 [Actinoplanes regularis]
MSHTGPYSGQPWSGGRPEEPYAEPSDPWGESRSGPAWEEVPQVSSWPERFQPTPTPPPRAPSRRGFTIAALIAVLSVVVGGGLATTVWFLLARKNGAETPAASASTPGNVPRPQTSSDARFAAKGQCVRNEGTNTQPDLRIVACAANTFEVLRRFDGRATGERDAVAKCGKVPGYTKWYYYDTEYDDLDYVLCLREYQSE